MREILDKKGRFVDYATLEEDIANCWKKHGLEVIEEKVIKGNKWIIKAKRIK